MVTKMLKFWAITLLGGAYCTAATATGFKYLGSTALSTYTISEATSNWNGALVACNQTDMRLLSVETAQENLEVRLFMVKNDAEFTVWTSAAYNPALTKYIWAPTGEDVNVGELNEWEAGHPMNLTGYAATVTNDVFKPTSTWSSSLRGTLLRYVCEGDNPVTTTTDSTATTEETTATTEATTTDPTATTEVVTTTTPPTTTLAPTSSPTGSVTTLDPIDWVCPDGYTGNIGHRTTARSTTHVTQIPRQS
ncbi:cell wall integrity and stress response component 4 [Folsomia candida]|uniref:cell wall integrity and stress response component 4 n=1 Tax=Folsomia candida TaxID=158441 RepID=UPI000B8F4589|nr:cell wall integrity and stress response component 4 [Folsomia candida]XP_021943425.1 cell wall integrity and stress response component 4 [Folsomia candida]